MSASSPLVVAIDGYAAAGKGTLGQSMGKALGWAFLDTGLAYRMVAFLTLRNGNDAADQKAAAEAAGSFTPEAFFAQIRDGEHDLRTPIVSQGASKVARFEEVRSVLRAFQRQFALNPPPGFPGAVLDGRDIGTEVCPEAPVKLFITARVEVRTARMMQTLQERGIAAIESNVMREIRERDHRDTTSPIGRLRPVEDSVLLDTSDMSAPQVLEAAMAIVRQKLPGLDIWKNA